MVKGIAILQLKFDNFGPDNIRGTVKFNRNPSFVTDANVFEALRVFLDPDYLNETVTKPNYPGDDSFVELTLKLNERELVLKRVFGQRGRNVDEIDQNGVLNTYMMKLPETCYATPQEMIHHVMTHSFGCEQLLVDSLKVSARKADSYRRLALDITTPQEMNAFKDAIKRDLAVKRKIDSLIWKWTLSTHNPKNKNDSQIMKILPVDPMESSKFCDTVVNVFIASLQSNIVANQLELCNHSIETIKREAIVHQPNDQIFLSPTWEKLKIADIISDKSVKFSKDKSDLHLTNAHIASLYKQNFQTAEAWENEKEVICQKRLDEIAFSVELKHEESKQKNAALDLVEEIKQKAKRIEELTGELQAVDVDINELITYVFSEIQTYILYFILDPLNELCDALCDSLNHPLLEIADIKNHIAGLVFRDMYDIDAQCPDLLFDHVASHKEHIFKLLQSYLAPLSKIQFFDKSEMALTYIERLANEIMANATDHPFETTFTVTAQEAIDGREPSEGGALLSEIRKSFSYKDNFKPLLSNFRITGETSSERTASNLLNLRTKVSAYVTKARTMATESNKLFQLLQSVHRSFAAIGDILSDLEQQSELIRKADRLMVKLNNFCEIESMLNEELSNIRILSFREFNATHSCQEINRLLIDCATRKNIYDNLLALQYTDDIDKSSIMEIMTQQKTDVSDLSVVTDKVTVESALNVLHSLQLAKEVQKIFYDVSKKHTRLTITHEMNRILEIWRSIFKDVSIESNDALQEKVLTCLDLDLTFLCTNYSGGQRIDASYDNIFRRVDTLMSQLRYPLCPTSRLNRASYVVKKLRHLQYGSNNIVLSNQAITISEPLNKYAILEVLCNELTSLMQQQNVLICCEIDPSENDDLTADAMRLRRLCPMVRFYGKRGDIIHKLNPFEARLVTILLYVLYVRLFTMQPIVLDRLLEGCADQVIHGVLTFLKPEGRWTLIRISSRTIADWLGNNIVQVVYENSENVDDLNMEVENAEDVTPSHGQAAPHTQPRDIDMGTSLQDRIPTATQPTEDDRNSLRAANYAAALRELSALERNQDRSADETNIFRNLYEMESENSDSLP